MGYSLVDASYGCNEHVARPQGIIQWNNTKVTCEVALSTILICQNLLPQVPSN